MRDETNDSQLILEGGLWEEPTWELQRNAEISYGHRCPHCSPSRTVTHTRKWDGSTWDEEVWTCPLVIVAYNECRNNTTGLCAACVLETLLRVQEQG